MNFTYLENQKDFSTLLTYCNECESFACSSADISITAARKAMEYMVKLLYGTHITSDIRGLTLFDMLSDYDFVDYIGNRTLLDSIHQIRRKGNQAVHEGNMSVQDAMKVLEKLHYVTGEVCIKLGLIESYPAFNPNIEKKAIDPVSITDEPEVDEALLQRISALMRRRMKSAARANATNKIVDVHVNPKEDAKNISQRKNSIGTDSGANGKAAHQYLAGYLADTLPDVQILMENVKSELILIKDKKETVLTIKTGCTNLGTKDYDGNWQLLPGVDYVLYSPDIAQEHPLEKQFHLFSRDAFIAFWEDLGLLRFKVSTAMRKRIASQLGPDEKITTDKYADVISIQSFTNSGRKYPLVKQKLTEHPLLSSIDLHNFL